MHIFPDDAELLVSGCVIWHNCVILGGEPHREHKQDSPKWTCGVLWHMEMLSAYFSLMWRSLQAIYSLTSLEIWSLLYRSTAAPTFLVFSWTVHLFILLTLSMTVLTWISHWMDWKETTICVPPPTPFSWFHGFGFFLWGYVKDWVYSQRVIALYELRAQVIAAVTNVTKDMLEHVQQLVDYRWDIRRATDNAHCEVNCDQFIVLCTSTCHFLKFKVFKSS
jgi:hypothetical protein